MGVNLDQYPSQLAQEESDLADIIKVDVEPAMPHLLATLGVVRPGKYDLVQKVDDPEPLFITDHAPGLPILLVPFIRSMIQLSLTIPAVEADKVARLIFKFNDCFSWYELDLGTISDVPFSVTRINNIPAVLPPRRHLYNSKNESVIRHKFQPLIDMGIFLDASRPTDVIHMAQVCVVRHPLQKDDLDSCKVVHDFRLINSDTQIDTYPISTLAQLHAWKAEFDLWFSCDADWGFLQIVCKPSSIKHMAFELFHKLFVSTRMLFGCLNGPAVFARNTDVMLRYLKFKERSVLNYFDDILGGSSKKLGNSDWGSLYDTFENLLIRARLHGWKFKPKKLKYGFTEIEVFGMKFSGGRIQMGKQRINAVVALQPPKSKSQVRSILGLANCFRDRVPGCAIRVEVFTKLTRSSPKNHRF